MTWCFLPDTASPSVQAAADLTWVLTLPSRALPPPVSSSGKNTPEPSSLPHSAPDISPPLQSGTTCKPSTADLGAASVTPCLPDTHASRSPQRDSERARTIPATSGRTLPGSSTRFSPNGSSLRTFRATSALALKPCCEPYGTWASRLRLAYSLRLKLVRRMKGSGSSSWPTATAMQTREGWTEAELAEAREKARIKANNGNGFGLGLGAVAGMWPTATAHSFAQTADDPTPGQTGGTTLAGAAELQWQTPVSDDAPDRSKGKINSRGEPKLSGQAIIWGAPRASDAEKGGPNQAFGAGGIPLPAQAAQWPTPAAQNVKGSSEGSITRADGKSRMDILHYRAEQGFSRPAHLTAPPGPKLSQLRPIWRPLRASLIASHGRAVWRRLWTSREKARLNPAFVAWLMGWPPGHALCASSAMAWSLWQRDMRGALSALPTASGAWIWKPSIERMKPVQRDLFAELDA